MSFTIIILKQLSEYLTQIANGDMTEASNRLAELAGSLQKEVERFKT